MEALAPIDLRFGGRERVIGVYVVETDDGPARHASDSAARGRPRGLGDDPGRDRAPLAGAAGAHPLRRRLRSGPAPRRAPAAPAEVGGGRREGDERGGVRRNDAAGGGRGRAPDLRGRDALVAVVRRPEALLGQAARSRVSGADLELVEAAAFAALWGAVPESVRREHDVCARTIAGAVCTAVGAAPGETMINRVTALGLREPATDAALDEIEAFFRDAGTRYAIGISPFSPPDLAERLEARGFEPGYAWMKFRRGVEPLPQPETALRVEEIGGASRDA